MQPIASNRCERSCGTMVSSVPASILAGRISYVRRLGGWKRVYAISLLVVAAVIASPAQTFTTLGSFDVANGAAPSGSLVQGFDGSLYGT